MSKKKRGGSRVLYLRVTQELLDGLEAVRKRQAEENRGMVFSTADIARAILWKAIAVEGGV